MAYASQRVSVCLFSTRRVGGRLPSLFTCQRRLRISWLSGCAVAVWARRFLAREDRYRVPWRGFHRPQVLRRMCCCMAASAHSWGPLGAHSRRFRSAFPNAPRADPFRTKRSTRVARIAVRTPAPPVGERSRFRVTSVRTVDSIFRATLTTVARTAAEPNARSRDSRRGLGFAGVRGRRSRGGISAA